MRIIDRLDKYMTVIKLNDNKVTVNCGLSVGLLGKARQLNNDIGKKAIEKILNFYQDINRVWLLTGEGEMLKTSLNEIAETTQTKNNNYKLVPLYNFDTVGGMNVSAEVIDNAEYIDSYIPFPNANTTDICIPVTGSSMIPTYPSGCIVLLREVQLWREYFGYGNVFVLFLKDGRRILKEVQKSNEDTKENVLCVSYNAKNPAEELPKSMISKVFKVIRVLTNEGF